jgi:hypothetical protein
MLMVIVLILVGLIIIAKLMDTVGYYLPSILAIIGLVWLSDYVWNWLCIGIGIIIVVLNAYLVLKTKGEI